jgi:hypothetical protein
MGEIRKKIFGDPAEIIPQYPFGAPLRRKNRLTASPRWDPLWPRRLATAARELKHDHITVNARMMFRTEGARDATMRRAEVLWAEELAWRKSQW